MGRSQRPGEGPFDRPDRDAGDPIGDDAYPGGSGPLPPTGDMDDPVPETGMPGGSVLGEDEGVEREPSDRAHEEPGARASD